MKTLLLPFSLFFPFLLLSQVAPYSDMSYDAFLCEEELYKDQIICLNRRIVEEIFLIDFPDTAFEHCEYADILPSFSSFGLLPPTTIGGNSCDGVCCGNGDFSLVNGGKYDHLYNRTAYYTIDLVCLNNTNGVSITKVNSNCWNVKYLEIDTFFFSLEVTVRPGREIEENGYNCSDTTYFYNCGLNRVWKQFVVNISNQNECVDYLEEPCNLIQNGDFEDEIFCPLDDPNAIPNHLKYYNFQSLNNWEILTIPLAPYFASTCGNYFGVGSTGNSNSNYQNFPPQPLPSGDNYLLFDQYTNITGQFLDLCSTQKYKFGFTGIKSRGNYPSNFVNLSGTNTSDFSTNPLITPLTTIIINPNLFTWNQYSSEFISATSFNGITISGRYSMIDNLFLVPVS